MSKDDGKELIIIFIILLVGFIPIVKFSNIEAKKAHDAEVERFNNGYCVNDNTKLKLITISDGEAYYHCDTCGNDFAFYISVTNIEK